ncbi:DNRLRE domain-containing protein [Ruania alkalisoli]|uniref:DNRLRE domain-containing protein n=1 Tax=Ruania alkalisoli TaxID=2779775 RepID=A0A7M1SU77_9MICO|nr:polysaccharide lyase family 8 super-sandwich domain-containing protein [Ruania alkalisoli]QOR70597.1 DNRLRE domain-containing protein [Ruania alkalisoli]
MVYNEVAFSRRTLLGVGAALGATAALGHLGARPAWATDDYEYVRERFRADLVGSRTVDPDDPAVAAIVAGYDDACDERLDQFSPSSQGVFADLNITGTSSSAPVSASFTGLRSMAYAFAVPGGRYTGSSELADQIVTGLQTMNDLVYNVDQPEYDNWWTWEIGSTGRIIEILTMCHEVVPADLRAALCDAMAHFVPDPGFNYPPDSPRRVVSSGANRINLCRAVILEGILMRRPDRIELGIETFLPALEVSDTGNGLLSDGSFVQHNQVAYTGAYGCSYLNGASSLVSLMPQTPWEMADSQVAALLRSIDDAYTPLVFNGQLAASLRGRAVSYPSSSDSGDGQVILSSALRLARQADPETAARWRGLCLGWIERSRHYDIRASAALPLLALIEEAEALAPPIQPQPIESRTFPGMDRVVHQRPGWSANVAIGSTRINKFEVMNRENRTAWHHGDGFLGLYLENEEVAQFDDNFWPTVDPYRIPGTTVDSQPRPILNGGGLDSMLGFSPMVGGCVVGGEPNPPAQRGTHAIWTARERNWRSSMEATLSWFFLDDGIVALGSGINAPIVERVSAFGDAYVRGGTYADNNYSTAGYLPVRKSSSASYTRETYFQFSLADLPARIRSATLYFNADVDDSGGTEMDVEVHAVDGEWVENTITWNNRPPTGERLATVHVVEEPRWHAVEMTEHVRELLAAGDTLSVVLLEDPPDGTGLNVKVRGRTSSTSTAPYLEIELDEPTPDTYPIETILENRKVPGDDVPAWSVDGVPVSGSDVPGWRDAIVGTTAHLPGTAGYLMLDGERTFDLTCDERTGDWHRIREREDDTPIIRTYQTAWLDHGRMPTDASFAYHLLPRISAQDLADLAESPSAVVVANEADRQAVAAPGQGYFAAAFHAAGEVRHGRQSIRAEAPCTVATLGEPGAGGSFEISVADPARDADVVEVQVSLPPGLPLRVTRADDTIDLSISNGVAHLTVRTAETYGRSQRILFTADV